MPRDRTTSSTIVSVTKESLVNWTCCLCDTIVFAKDGPKEATRILYRITYRDGLTSHDWQRLLCTDCVGAILKVNGGQHA
jgi:hypothetical protein